jgi:hypothetical protein
MKRGTLSSRPGPKGQSLIEFAISLTVILLLLAGSVDFGIGLFHYIAMRDAAQEGALYGSINPPPGAGSWNCPDPNVANICARLVNASGEDGIIKKMYDSGMLVIITAPVRACEGHALTVILRYDYPISMPFLSAILGSDHIRLRATATDTILTPPCP